MPKQILQFRDFCRTNIVQRYGDTFFARPLRRMQMTPPAGAEQQLDGIICVGTVHAPTMHGAMRTWEPPAVAESVGALNTERCPLI